MDDKPNTSCSEFEIRKINEYEAYVMWHSFPPNYRGLDLTQLKELHVPEEYIDLLQIKSHTDFSKRYGIDLKTLARWRKTSKFDNDLVDLVDADLFHEFYARIMRSFSLKTAIDGDPNRVRLWLEKFAGHTERISIQVQPDQEDDSEGHARKVIEGQSIMDIVIQRVSRNRGIESSELSEMIEDVEHEDVDEKRASQQAYDFEEIAKKHNQQEKEKEVKKAQSNGDASSDVKKRLLASINKITKNGSSPKKKK